MTALVWDKVGERFFEAGVDRGVFYPKLGPGVSWSGLTAVTENVEGGEITPYYIDGRKYLNVPSSEDFACTIEAVNFPQEFASYDGTVQVGSGLFLGQQPRKSFGFSYRTRVGNDISGEDYGYKVHLVYNALAAPSERGYKSIGESVDQTTFSWEISTTPVISAGYKPMSHVVIDSTKIDPNLLNLLEGYLYGSAFIYPQLPSIAVLLDIFERWAPIADLNVPMKFQGKANSDLTTVTNLFTNPSFETASGTTEVWRNLATNPSFENTSGTVEVRRNLLPDPLGATEYSISAGGGSFTQTYPATGGPVNNCAYRRYTCTVSNTTVFYHTFGKSGTFAPVVAGTSYSVSVWVRSSVAFTCRLTPTGHTDSAGSGWIPVPDRPSAVLVPNTWTQFVSLSVPSATVTYLRVIAEALNTFTFPVGATFDVALAVVETSTSKRSDSFYGGYSPDSDLTPSWTGTANASASILSGVAVVGTVTTLEYFANIASNAWCSSGSKSLRVIPTAATNDTYAAVSGDLGAIRLGMSAGKTYTVKAKCRLISAQTGSLSTDRARAIVFHYKSPGGYVATCSNQAPNGPGITDCSLTFTVPADATEAFIRLYNGASAGNGDVWWDDFLLVEGVYNGPYFDGANPAVWRRNLHTAPIAKMSAPWASNWGTSGDGATVLENGMYKITWTSAPSGGNQRIYLSSATQIPVTPGETIYVSVDAAGNVPVGILFDWYKDSTWISLNTLNPVAVSSDTANPTRISKSFVVPANINFLSIALLISGNASIGTWIAGNKVFVERSVSAGSYFDGSSGYNYGWEGAANASPSRYYDQDLTPSWVGTANASASVLTAQGLFRVASSSSSNAKVVRSGMLHNNVSKALRIIPVASSKDTCAVVAGDPGGLVAQGVTFEAGKTYTVKGTVIQLAAQTGTPQTERASIQVSYNNVAGWTGWTHIQSANAPNAIGSTDLSVTFTLPMDVVWAQVRLYNGAGGGDGDVYWDNIVLVEGTYDGPYFSGASGDLTYHKQKITPIWNGSADASTSKFTILKDLDNVGSNGDAYAIDGDLWVQINDIWKNTEFSAPALMG